MKSVLGSLFGDQRPTRWVTRERPKIDRIACPWLILRFIDPQAEFLFVPTEDVIATAEISNAVAFDIPGAPFSHSGPLCSFDAFVDKFGIADRGVQTMAPIIRGADTDRRDLAPEAAGLHAISLGLSLNVSAIMSCCDKASSSMTRSIPGRRERAASGTTGNHRRESRTHERSIGRPDNPCCNRRAFAC